MKIKKKDYWAERFVRIPSNAKHFFRERRKANKGRRSKLKRHEYRLRCKELVSYFKIPYLRFSPNPFSIAFLILVIFSSDVWPHMKPSSSSSSSSWSYYVSGTPTTMTHVRHFNHVRMLTAAAAATAANRVNQNRTSSSSSASSSSSSSPSPSKSNSYPSSDKFKFVVNTRYKKNSFNGNLNTLRNEESGEMFLKWLRPHQFLKRFGRSSKAPRISSNSKDEYSSPKSFTKTPTTKSSSSSTSISASSSSASPSSPSSSSSSSSSSSASSLSASSAPSSPIPLCSHIGDETNEISARAYAAETVFEGKVRSKSTIKDPVGKYGVTFVVQRVYKDQSNTLNALRPKTQVRLFFVEKTPPSNITKPTAHCVQRYNFTKRSSGSGGGGGSSSNSGDLTKANIKRGRRYIVFVNRIGPHNYTIIGEPVPQTKKNTQAVNDVLCRSCVKQIGVWGLKNETVNIGEQLRLVCRIKGTPLPALQWFKDGAPVIVTSRLRIQYKKKRSLLVIPKVRNSDSGKYECRGLGVQSVSPVSTFSIVSINARFDNITALWPLVGKPCPPSLNYCLNGGICTYYETIGEFTCQCADGFNGGRCENKDVVNSNSTYEPITCYDGVTPSYPCVTVHKPLDDYA